MPIFVTILRWSRAGAYPNSYRTTKRTFEPRLYKMASTAFRGESAKVRMNTIRTRLASNIYLAVGAALICLALVLFLGGTILDAILAVVAILIVAAMVPDDKVEIRGATREETGSSAIDRLSALSLAGAISDPLVIFTGRFETVYQNDAARSTFGELPQGQDLRTVFRMPSMIRLISEVVAKGQSATTDMSERVPVERSFRVIADPIGDDTGLFILLFKDQSEARRIDRMRSDFIANASHELRTPLASIAGFIETLRGPAKEDATAREQFLEIMQEQTSRMSRLIDDLLSLSRAETKPNLVPGRIVDLRLVLDAVIEAFSNQARRLDVKVQRDYEAGDFIVAGDRDELFQVFQNLIENACKYGHQGGRILVFLKRRTNQDPPSIAAGVQDFGPGIPPEHVSRITERFYRVDVEDSRTQRGTGLGLSIVKHIVNRHNAELEIVSEPGEGAMFTVLFPSAGNGR